MSQKLSKVISLIVWKITYLVDLFPKSKMVIPSLTNTSMTNQEKSKTPPPVGPIEKLILIVMITGLPIIGPLSNLAPTSVPNTLELDQETEPTIF